MGPSLEGGRRRAAGEALCSWLMRESIRLSLSRGADGILAWSGRLSGLWSAGWGPLVRDATDAWGEDRLDGGLLET